MKSVAILMLSGAAILAGGQALSAKYEQQETLSLDSAELAKLEVNSGAGDLRIKGEDTATQISVTATIGGRYIEPEDYTLYLREHGDRAFLYAHLNEGYRGNGYIDLQVEVPSQLRLRVLDKSGDTKINNMQNGVWVEDSSGNLDLNTISGGVTVKDTSGDTHLTTINGNVNVNDGSGDLVLTTVNGNVVVDDGSGDINVKTVLGNLDIEDGSGDIEAYGISGTMTADDGSGDIYVDGADRFTLVSDGSGDVELSNVTINRQ